MWRGIGGRDRFDGGSVPARALNQRGYQLLRLQHLRADPAPCNATGTAPAARSGTVEIHTVDASTAPAWSTTLLDGFGYTRHRPRPSRGLEPDDSLAARVTALVAVMDGQPVGAASVMVLGASAMLGGAATPPAFRRRGVQRTLIEARLAVAAHAGCTLAIVTADPGEQLGRNAERTGFQLICNHVSMRVRGSRGRSEPVAPVDSALHRDVSSEVAGVGRTPRSRRTASGEEASAGLRAVIAGMAWR